MNKKNIADFYPLSPMQQGMLFHSLAAPESGVYVEQTSCLLQGDVNIPAFVQAWEQVVQRHPILRTGFLNVAGKEPIQLVQKQVTLPVFTEDWQAFDAETQANKLNAFTESEREKGFDLAKPPLMRLALLRTGQHAVRFVWTFHHILLDGWSLPILLQEVFACYEMNRSGETMPLPPTRPFRDYIVWLKKQNVAQAAAFWQERLAGFYAPTPLVVDHGYHEIAGEPVYGEMEVRVSREKTAVLQSLARQHQLTINTFVQAAWALLLHRYSGEEDVLFGATVSGRPPELPGSEMMVGLFINTLPVRIQIDPTQSAIAWLKQIQAQQSELRQYEFSPLIDIQGWSEVPRGLPLFESILVFENYPITSVTENDAISLSLADVQSVEQTNFPLTVVAGLADELHLKIAYDGQRFDPDTIGRMLNHLQQLLLGIADQPTEPVLSLPLLTPIEWQHITKDWNGRTADYPLDLCVHELFEIQVEETPEAVAAIYDGTKLTYQALNQRANQLAHYLIKQGIGPESIVGICVNRSLDMIVSLLGVLKAGGAYLPLDPTYPAERIAYMIEDAQPEMILTQEAISGQLSAINNQQSTDNGQRATGDHSQLTINNQQLIILPSDWSKITKEPTTNPITAVTPKHLAYIIYTSGSTGQPKGTLLQHRGLVNFANALTVAYGLGGSGKRILQFAPFSFDASVAEIFIALLSGATLYLPSPETVMAPAMLHKYLQENKITLATLPPTMLKLLDADDLPNLEVVISAGEACTPDLVQQWANGRRFFNGYGPTEATVGPALYEVKPDELANSQTVPIGHPIANTQIYLLDAYQRPVPIGVPAEIHIGGVGLARGYLNQPKLTTEKFIPNPFQDNLAARLYKTGDLAQYRPDGTLLFLGRIDHQVKLRGFRIELGEIEAQLERLDVVKTAVLLVREDTPGDKRLVAYVQPVAGMEVDETAVRDHLQTNLPSYMIPTAFVMMDAFPLTPNRKINRKALPAPDSIRTVTNYVPPRDEVEAALVKIWEDVLETQPVGVTDSFFALGGHSLLALRIMAQVQQQFTQVISLTDLFQQPTIAHLASVLRQENDSSTGPMLVGLQTRGEKRPLFFIHPSGGSVHWYAELAGYLGEERPFYGIQAQGLFGETDIHTRVDEMAFHYIQLIQTVQPEGPYLLASWSMGVSIVYEMAQQLHQQGQQVALLLMLDQGPTLPASEPEDNAAYLVEAFGKNVPVTLETLRTFSPDEQIAQVFHEAKKVNWITPDVTLPQFHHFVKMLRTHTEAWRAYQLKPYPGHITIIRAQEQTEAISAPGLGWEKLAQSGINVVEVPGNHITMLHEPQVQELAAAIKQELANTENNIRDIEPVSQQGIR